MYITETIFGAVMERQPQIPFDFAQGRLSTAIGAKHAPKTGEDIVLSQLPSIPLLPVEVPLAEWYKGPILLYTFAQP